MKKIINIILITIMCFYCGACSKSDNSSNEIKEIVPQVAHMKYICELATMDYYYHNVAKYMENDASGALLWKKDRRFWVEYAGVVTVGIDTSLVNIEVNGENVTITIPPAKVLSCKVDDETLTEDSFIVAKGSAKVEAKHQTEVFKEAQEKLQEQASNNTLLLENAQQRAQKLLEDYVNNIGNYVGKNYKIKWIYMKGTEELHNIDTDENSQVME